MSEGNANWRLELSPVSFPGVFAVQLVMFVESRFGIPVNGDDLDIRNFRTISEIDRFVYERMATVPA